MPQLRPTFSESWYRVVNLKARLRGSTQISRQHYRGERWYVVRDPAGNQYHRLSSAAYRFVGLLDGTRTIGEAWEVVGGQLADNAPTQPEVIQILSQLHAANLLEANITADAGVLLRRHKQFKKRQFQGRLMNVLFPRIPLWDPDRFLKKWLPVMRLFISKFGAVLWLAVVISAIAVLVPRWTDLKSAAVHAVDIHTNAINYVWLFLTFVVIKLIHELGHGFTCRRFGGEVHELGIMFLVFIPAPYVDASSAWALPNKWSRALIGAGGMIFELFVAAILAFVWASTPPETMLNKLAYNAMLIASVSTVIFNINPLLRYDGYYILSDLLEIPNLSQKAKDYSLGLIKRHLFGVKDPLPLPPVKQRIWLFVYAITSGIYRVFVGIMIILVVSAQVPVLGVLMALGGVVTWVFVPLGKIGNYLLLEPELHRKRGRAIAFVGTSLAAVIVLVGLVPFPVHFTAIGYVEAKNEQYIHAQYSGFVTRILVKDGQVVHQGDLLLVMTNKELEANVIRYQAEIQRLKDSIAAARIDDQSQEIIDSQQLFEVKKELTVAQDELSHLQVKAPIDGVVIAPKLDEMQGRHLNEGDDIALVAQLDNLVVKTVVSQSDVALLHEKPDRVPEVRLACDRTHTLLGQLEHAEPSVINALPNASLGLKGGGDFETKADDPKGVELNVSQAMVLVDLSNRNGQYIPGETATVRFSLAKKPLIYGWTREFLQLLQTQNARNKWL